MSGEKCSTTMDKWSSREMQLNVLHEEILMRREALLHTSENFLRLQSSRSQKSGLSSASSLPPSTQALIRNQRLLKDCEDLSDRLREESATPPSTRFLALQADYWTMVRTLLPKWEEARHEGERGSHSRRTPSPTTHPSRSPRSRRTPRSSRTPRNQRSMQ